MAYTKVFAIRARLDDRVKYAVNAEKTELNEKIGYAADLVKTSSVRFVTALNCKSAETAFDVMRKTKEKFGKTGGVLGYHFIQSFAPGEVTPMDTWIGSLASPPDWLLSSAGVPLLL